MNLVLNAPEAIQAALVYVANAYWNMHVKSGEADWDHQQLWERKENHETVSSRPFLGPAALLHPLGMSAPSESLHLAPVSASLFLVFC